MNTSNRLYKLAVALGGVFLCLPFVRADEVIMRNGDRLTGKVVRQSEGVLKLETSYAGSGTRD